MDKQLIFEEIYRIVQDTMELGEYIYWDPESKSFSSLTGSDEHRVKELEIIEIIKKQIDLAIKYGGLVYLYVCRDNELVGFEDWKDIIDGMSEEEIKETKEMYNDEIVQGLIVGWD